MFHNPLVASMVIPRTIGDTIINPSVHPQIPMVSLICMDSHLNSSRRRPYTMVDRPNKEATLVQDLINLNRMDSILLHTAMRDRLRSQSRAWCQGSH